MRRIIFSLVFVVFLISSASAGIVINQQPGGIYSLGDMLNLPLKITAVADIEQFFNMYLYCNGFETEIYREYIVLRAGEEKEINPYIPLTQGFLGRTSGTCSIKLVLGVDYVLTNEFEISNGITVTLKDEELVFSPGESLIIEADAIKDNGVAVNGYVDAVLFLSNVSGNTTISDTVKNGYLYIDYPLPENTEAGKHAVRLNIYETNLNGEITNGGSLDSQFVVLQVPKSLELIFETQNVEPGTNLKVKGILHDQTGREIDSNVEITLWDEKRNILEQSTVSTGEYFEYATLYNEPTKELEVTALSNQLEVEGTFTIIENAKVKTEIFNKTLLVTNIGNVPYCDKTVLIRIGDETLNVDVCLDVDESQKYLLKAPDGEYEVEVITNEGSSITGMVTLTGKTVEVKEAVSGVGSLIRHPVVWIFIICILGFVAFMVFRKGYQRSFFGYIPRVLRKKEGLSVPFPPKKGSLINPKNKAELSLSIKGDKQNVSVACLNLKNMESLVSGKKEGGAREVLQKVVDMAEQNKGVTYENQDNIFFIFVPTKTKTFKNEKTAVEFAQNIKDLLTTYNKTAKEDIEFGIGLNYGTMISKQEKDAMKFMSLGTLITGAKKFAMLSDKNVFLTDKIKDKLGAYVKTEKQMKGNVALFTIKQIKHVKEENKKFISDFMKRMEK